MVAADIQPRLQTVVVSQSMYFPWCGLLDQIRQADVFVYYDDVQLVRGFCNRVQVKTLQGYKWITVPLLRKSQKQLIHNGAYIVIAENTLISKQKLSKDRTLKKKILRLGKFWSSTAKRIRKFEKKLPNTSKSVIYGAGFYGTFLASSLINHKKIICFLDQNKFLKGRTMLGKPIIFPSKLPKCIDTIYVALNPKNSRKVIKSSKFFTSKKFKFFYI